MSEIVMVGGSRGYWNREKIAEYVSKLSKDTVLIHGDCKNSPDEWAGRVAEWMGLVVGKFPYVEKMLKAGGHERNRVMVRLADRCVFFWDGKSSGTGKTIEYAKSIGKPHLVILP